MTFQEISDIIIKLSDEKGGSGKDFGRFCHDVSGHLVTCLLVQKSWRKLKEKIFKKVLTNRRKCDIINKLFE